MPLGLETFTRSVAKRARRGLYAGRKVLSGNNVSEDGGNRTRRQWKPNAQKCTLFSDILDRKVQLRVTTAALRNIDKAGSLDNYILNTPDKYLQSDVAVELKIKMLQTMLRQQMVDATNRGGEKNDFLPPAAQAAATGAHPDVQ